MAARVFGSERGHEEVVNLAQTLRASALALPSRPAIIVDDVVDCSYAQFADRVAARAGDLVSRNGVRPGDRVGLFMTNRPDYLEALYAVWWAGAVAVPLNSMMHPREAVALLDDCKARVCLVSPDLAEGMLSEAPNSAVIRVIDATELLAARKANAIGCSTATASDDAWIFYTSGTTGKPKGALLTHSNLFAMAIAYLADTEWVDDRSGLLHIALQSHASGLFALPFVARGAAQVIPTATDPATIARLLTVHERLSFFAPPVLMRRLAVSPEIQSAPLERMGTLLVGAAPVYAEDLRLALGTFGPRIWNGYGQGETPCTITAMGQRQMAAAAAAGDDVLLSSVGVPRLGIEVKIMQDDVEVSDGDIGEVCVRGETVMRGYLDRPEETAESLRGGWLHTGDLGRWERGHLQLLDRSKDMVISGGSNIYPREIEDRLLQEPTVAEVAVIGLPDPEWGERVVAIIVTAPGCTLDADRLDAFCLESMARYKRPKEYLQVDSLPRNGAGKVLKRELREQLQAKE